MFRTLCRSSSWKCFPAPHIQSPRSFATKKTRSDTNKTASKTNTNTNEAESPHSFSGYALNIISNNEHLQSAQSPPKPIEKNINKISKNLRMYGVRVVESFGNTDNDISSTSTNRTFEIGNIEKQYPHLAYYNICKFVEFLFETRFNKTKWMFDDNSKNSMKSPLYVCCIFCCLFVCFTILARIIFQNFQEFS